MTRVRWLASAAVPSALSLGVTLHISTDIAAIPLLWIAPLALYLLSFVVAFSRRNPLTAPRAAAILPFAGLAIVIAPFLALPIWLLLASHLSFLFVAAVMCHARLAAERPDPTHLTEFYLVLSLGGAMGGVFVSLVAPLVFDRVWEYPIAIVAALLLRPPSGRRYSRKALGVVAAVVLAAVLVMLAAIGDDALLPTWVALVGLAAALIAVARWRVALAEYRDPPCHHVDAWRRHGVCGPHLLRGVSRHLIGRPQFSRARNHGPRHAVHCHGPTQCRDDVLPRFRTHRPGVRRPRDRRSSGRVVGLGVGTLARYGLPGQS